MVQWHSFGVRYATTCFMGLTCLGWLVWQHYRSGPQGDVTGGCAAVAEARYIACNALLALAIVLRLQWAGMQMTSRLIQTPPALAEGACCGGFPAPDCFHVTVLHLQGNSSSYYATSNSCLDSVLASRAGLPITLALLHAAVGEAAGLRVQLVGMPGHVITRALIGVQGSQGSAGTGLNPGSRGSGADAGEGVAGGEDTGGSGSSSSGAQAQQGEEPNGGSDEGRVGVQGSRSDSWMYVDVFNGGVELSDDDLR
jgi:hypothetical protein